MNRTRASLADIPVQELPGRTLQWLVTGETLGAKRLSVAIMKCPAGSVLRPMHAHMNTEEVILVLEGIGEALIDGEVTSFGKGDAVIFPADCKHMLRNTGDQTLVTASIFVPPSDPSHYTLYPGEGW